MTQRLCAASHRRLVDYFRAHRIERAEALADYITVQLYGLSAAARGGMSRQALRRAARVAADGFAAQLD